MVRSDLSMRQQLVQAVHAGMASAAQWPCPDCYLVVLTVPDEAALVDASNRLAKAKVQSLMFYEPDHAVGMRVTALATQPLDKTQSRLLRRFKLWSD